LIENYDRNDLANLGVVFGFDSRYESFGLAHLMSAIFKAYGIRVFCLDRYAAAPFLSYFTKKFKCLLGIMVTGRD
jgi:phosphoglucomutase